MADSLMTYSPDNSSALETHVEPSSALAEDSAVPETTDVAEDEAAASETGQATGSETPQDETAISGDFLTSEERAALEAEPDPAKRLKGFERAFMARTRQLADTRKALGAWDTVREAFDRDAKATVRALARQVGLEIPDPEATAADATTETASAPDLAEEIATALKEDLGIEYEDLAERLAPGLARAVDRIVTERTKPLETRVQSREEALMQEAAQKEVDAVVEAFGKAHPDYKQHEPAMLALMAKLPPAPGVPEGEYLEMLYTLVTKDTRVAEETKRTITRMQRSASAATRNTSGVPADKVVERSQGPISFDEAARLAAQGIRVE